jgi:hypothetical protein
MENTGLQLSDLKVNNLPELQGWKEKQEKLVSENPFVEITDNKSYEVACKSRTNLLKGRTELEKQDKLIASQLTSFRKDVKLETDNLIAITLPFEERQQSEVKRFEAIKEAEKQEKELLEQLRIDDIKKRINSFETDSYKIIQETTIENVEIHKTMLNLFLKHDFDYEEYDVMFELAKIRVQTSWDAKCKDIKEKEEQRLENEKLAEENRLLKEANLERENKAKEEKEKIFEIRKVRLEEIGVQLQGECFFSIETDALCDKEFVFNSDTIEFETLITDAKLAIQKAKSNAEEFEKQKAIDLKLAEEDAERLKKENKQRVAKYSSDKKLLKEFVKSLEFSNPVPELENEDLQSILDNILLELQNTRGHLLTQINLF